MTDFNQPSKRAHRIREANQVLLAIPAEVRRSVVSHGASILWLEPGHISVREFQSADGLSRVAIVRRIDGLFEFASERLVEVDGYQRWKPYGASGIYETAAAAERSAMAELPWVFQGNSD